MIKFYELYSVVPEWCEIDVTVLEFKGKKLNSELNIKIKNWDEMFDKNLDKLEVGSIYTLDDSKLKVVLWK